MFGQRAYIGPPMAKRLSIVCGLLLVALFAGLLGARLLGGPFTSGRASDDRVQTERYALGRDIYHQDDYAVDTRYAPYTPGEKRIAKPTVAGARAIEPYEAARPAHRIEFSMDDGNFMEAQDLPRSDYGMIDPPAPARTDRARPSTQADTEGPENLLPRGYTRTETPSTRIAPAPERSVRKADPVADTERRIMDIATGRSGNTAPGNGRPNDSRDPASIGEQ